MLEAYGVTDIGLHREANEDSYSILPDNTYIVADGMGGHAAGDVASGLMVTAAEDALSRENIDETVLKEAVLAGNKKILAEAELHPERKGMGTTATLLHCEEERAYWAHVGDSRLYLLRSGKLQQITRDHSYVADLLANGTITAAEAETHPQRNMLLRAVGVSEKLQVDAGAFDLQKGDKLLICSDGLTKMVSDEEIRDILQNRQGQQLAQSLVDKAISAGGNDNVTVVVVER